MTAPSQQTLADDHLHQRWREMRNEAGPAAMRVAFGIVEAFAFVELLTAEQAELWRRRYQTCPGHEDEGGRAWCAYCGDLEEANENPEREGAA